MKKIFVTGGSGYIGSEFVHRINNDKEYEITVFDNLENGHKSNLDSRIRLIVGDLRDHRSISNAINEIKPDAVIHFAAYALVAESVNQPMKYYYNNIVGGLNLLDSMLNVGCNRIIFSSTCATYGIPDVLPIVEDSKQNPINPYGHSKYMFEQILINFAKYKKLNYTIFRYFNAAGADVDAGLYERHDPETHIIPNAINACKQNNPFYIYGNNYSTSDGTCVRDYIHIKDIADAHILALKNDVTGIYNLGTGIGISNRDIMMEIEKQTGQKIDIQYMPRRCGDPDELYANASKAKTDLKWSAKHSNISTIISDCLNVKVI